MQDMINILQATNPWLKLCILLIITWAISAILKHRLHAFIHILAKRTKSTWDDVILEHHVIQRLIQILPALIVYSSIPFLFSVNEETESLPLLPKLIQKIALSYGILMLFHALSAVLGAINSIYEQNPESKQRPIKGYIQVAKLITYCIATILIISVLIEKSPIILLSSFGALTAIILLVFKDTILSFVASIQLSSLDMLHVGDWIEMPDFNADGDVIDISLHTIRVQNWDKTITTIPTHRLISGSFKNWRGMTQSGGRRIRRFILIDMSSIRFLTPEETEYFIRFSLLKDYIKNKQTELESYNASLEYKTDNDVNMRKLTNLGTFRSYMLNYLKNHPHIHKNMTLLVRQLQPKPEGLPIEIYCFTNTTEWNIYENIQADIMDHLLAIMTEFDLKAYQQPSNSGLENLFIPNND